MEGEDEKTGAVKASTDRALRERGSTKHKIHTMNERKMAFVGVQRVSKKRARPIVTRRIVSIVTWRGYCATYALLRVAWNSQAATA